MKSRFLLSLLVLVLTAFGTGEPLVAAGEPASDRRAASGVSSEAGLSFDQVIASVTRDWFRVSPESASFLGVSEEVAGGPYRDRLGETGVEARQKRVELVRSIVQRFEALQETDLTANQRQMLDIQLFRYRQLLEVNSIVDYGTSYLTIYGPVYLPYPVMQMAGPHLSLTVLLEKIHPVTNVADAEAFVRRLVASSNMLAGLAEEVRADSDLGAVPPDFIVDKTEALLRNIIAPAPAEHPIFTSFTRRIDEHDIEGGDALKARALTALKKHTYPGYAALADEIASLRTRARHTASLSDLPNGTALYRLMMRMNTDTDMTAEEVHQIGLQNVTRIHSEMDSLMQQAELKEGSVPDRLRAMQNDPELAYPDTEEYKERTLREVRAMVDEINALAPAYFGRLPKAPLEVRRVPAYREATSAAGYYNSPSPDGQRPGVYYLNLRSTRLVPIWGLPSITYHEAVPGHHFQVALGLELEDLPLLQRVNTNTNAFAEGWGLYAERLAWEMGMYDGKPLADIGRLNDELHRAVRLVVDTGIHGRGWSREEAIDYMASTKGAEASGSESEVVSEIERYVAMPGQALGYMVGMLELLDLRAEAQNSLGDDFDIRAFHDAVLIKGGMPLPLLRADVRAVLGIESVPAR